MKEAIDAQVAAGGRPVQIQVDGGVKAHNIAMLRDWGVSNCVVGSGLFNDKASVADNLAVIHQVLHIKQYLMMELHYGLHVGQ